MTNSCENTPVADEQAPENPKVNEEAKPNEKDEVEKVECKSTSSDSDWVSLKFLFTTRFKTCEKLSLQKIDYFPS